LNCAITKPHYENGANHGTDVGQDGFLKEDMKTTQENADASQAKMLVEMKEEILAKAQSDRKERKVERKDDRKHMQEMIKTNQEKADADRESMKQMTAKIKTDRKEMISKKDAEEERMNASLREEIQSGQ
jgi:hypothetical protein